MCHLVIYNSGSVLNPGEMPPDFLGEIAAFARILPAGRVLSTSDSARGIYQPRVFDRFWMLQVSKSTRLRPILGVESLDDRIR